MSAAPALTLVTIVWNHRAGLAQTAQSVAAEAPAESEWVVVDGASTDGTVEEIRLHEARITRWISEKDRGIADAFNKGIGLAQGQYVLFLNAGDRLLPGAGAAISRVIAAHAGAPVIQGRIRMSGRVHGRKVPFWRQYMRNHLPHQAMLIRRDLFESLGGYDIGRRFGMDFEWSLRLAPHWPQMVFIPDVLTEMEPGGVSISNAGKTFSAWHEARVLHFSRPWLSKLVARYYWVKRAVLAPAKRLRDSLPARKSASVR